jgi:hypothetical protein
MKIAIILIGFLFTQFVSAAPSPKIFTGKFKSSSTLCPLYGPDRVYVTLSEDWDGNPFVEFNFYSDESAWQDVLLGSGARQAPGTSEEIHGRVIQSWTSEFVSNQHLVTVATTKSDRGEFSVTHELILRGDRLTLIEIKSDGEQFVCKMDRAN